MQFETSSSFAVRNDEIDNSEINVDNTIERVDDKPGSVVIRGS